MAELRPERVIVDVPKRFYADHVGRDCGLTGRVVKELSRTVRVDFDGPAFDDLYSDADYYSEVDEGFGPNEIALVFSARATLKRLQASARPQGARH